MLRFLVSSLVFLLLPLSSWAQSTSLAGRVLGPGGQAISEASVSWNRGDELVATTETSAEGIFWMPARLSGPFQVRVEAPGFVSLVRPVAPLFDSRGLPPAQLERGRRLAITVADEFGTPMSGAELRMSPLEDPTSDWSPAETSTLTDEAGRATLVVASDARLRLDVIAEGYAPHRRVLSSDENPTHVALELGRPVNLQISDSQEVPQAGVIVSLPDDLFLGTTDANGRLRITLPSGIVTLRCIAPNGAWAERRIPVDKTDPSIRVSLQSPYLVQGRVQRSQDGTPLANAWVWSPIAPEHATRTDSQGGFSLSIPLGRPATIAAVAVAHQLTEIPIHEGETVLSLPAATSLGGRLVDPSGDPIPDAAITLAPADLTPPPPEETTWAWSDGRGTFHLAGLPPSSEMWLRAQREGFVSQKLDLKLSDATEAGPLEITLERALRGLGTVLDARGQAVGDAEVHLLPSAIRDSAEALLTSGEHRITTRTDKLGRFHVEGLPMGDVDLRIQAPGWAPLRATNVSGTLQPNGLVDLGSFVLDPEAVVEGFVVSTAGEPLAGVEVSARDAKPDPMAPPPSHQDQIPPTLTDDEGYFVVPGLARSQSVNLRFERYGYAPVLRSGVEAPNHRSLHVEMVPATAIVGRVVDVEGSSVIDARVLAIHLFEDQQKSVGLTRSREDGSFALDGLPAGRVRLTVQASGFKTMEVNPVELLPGEILENLQVELSPGSVLTGAVQTLEGDPIAGARVLAHSDNPKGLHVPLETATEDDGAFRLSGLDPGRWTVTVFHPEYQRLQREVTIRDEEQQLDFQMQTGGEIDGRVVDAAGRPAAGAEVRLAPHPSGPAPTPVATTVDGTFRFSGLTPGRYRLTAKRTQETATRELEVTPTSRLDVEMHLHVGGSVEGRVLGLTPEQRRQARVVASAPATAPRSVSVSPDGGYRVRDLAPGPWRITAILEDGQTTTRQVEVERGADLRGVDLELGTGYRFTGRILRDGAPVPGAVLSIQRSSVPVGGTKTGPNGEFTVPSVRRGTYRIVVLDPTTGTTQTMNLSLENDLDLVIDLKAWSGG